MQFTFVAACCLTFSVMLLSECLLLFFFFKKKYGAHQKEYVVHGCDGTLKQVQDVYGGNIIISVVYFFFFCKSSIAGLS